MLSDWHLSVECNFDSKSKTVHISIILCTKTILLYVYIATEILVFLLTKYRYRLIIEIPLHSSGGIEMFLD